jgi:hypothetical protein
MADSGSGLTAANLQGVNSTPEGARPRGVSSTPEGARPWNSMAEGGSATVAGGPERLRFRKSVSARPKWP